MTNPEAAQHPALSLPGFTRAVTLSTGLEVHIRRVDLNAVTMAATRDLAADSTEEALQSIKDSIGQKIGIALDIQRRLLRASLIQPTLPELLALYGGSEEADDLGLGCDLATLNQAISEFNPQTAAPEAEVAQD